jgi:hypothetical protein
VVPPGQFTRLLAFPQRVCRELTQEGVYSYLDDWFGLIAMSIHGSGSNLRLFLNVSGSLIYF